MRFNKQELIALSSQTSHSFDREGILVLKEKQDGFFRRTEGSSVRWFRLRGNLLFHLKGPEPWYEPMGVIILGQHQLKALPQDENDYWPFQIVWDNGASYKIATFQEAERTLWMKAIESASYDHILSQVIRLREMLSKARPTVDITTYRQQKNIVIEMNEVPLCELALSCDNLLCDPYGKPPSPVAEIFVKNSQGPYIRYGATEMIEKSSNPCFSKTILFRSSDGLSGETVVRVLVSDMRERVSGTAVPMGSTALKLATIQEAQRLRVALHTRDHKTVGFITLSGWSLEPGAGAGFSTSDHVQRVVCHRRSQSLPPRLGLKLKCPTYGAIFRQNFVNSCHATYRFHSGLGGEIMVHEVMAEVKFCFRLPVQLLEVYMQRERELMSELVCVGKVCTHWRARRSGLLTAHRALLAHYAHSRSALLAQLDTSFKPSSMKDEARLEFSPVNLHVQRMWVHNDTLSKTGFHDVITAGAFAAHTHTAERAGGLIRMVQQMKGTNSSKVELNSMRSKIEAEYERVTAAQRLHEQASQDLDRVLLVLQGKQFLDFAAVVYDLINKVTDLVNMWDPLLIEEAMSLIGWTKTHCTEEATDQRAQRSEQQDLASPVGPGTASLGAEEVVPCTDPAPPSTGHVTPSTDQATPLVDIASPSRNPAHSQFTFDNDYFKADPQVDEVQKETGGSDCCYLDRAARDRNLAHLQAVRSKLRAALAATVEVAMTLRNTYSGSAYGVSPEDLENIKKPVEMLRSRLAVAVRWLRMSHAAMRLRCESPASLREHAALQTRRDTCFSQALTTVTAGLVCWLCSAPPEVIVKILSSDLAPLCCFEGLLSLYGAEKAMWGDMVVAVEDLQTVVFTLSKLGHSNSSVPHVGGSRNALVVYLPVTDILYGMFTNKESVSFSVTSVFFNIGINDKALSGDTESQHRSNCDNWDRLSNYYRNYTRLFTQDHAVTGRASSRTKPLEEVMENLRIAIQKKIAKNVEVIQLASLATRIMNGVSFISCKSAKDRTGMAVTLQQCSVLSAEYHLADHDMQKALDTMRSEGCRRENAFKNIGVNKYAFSKKQVMCLPREYRPPHGSYSPTAT